MNENAHKINDAVQWILDGMLPVQEKLLIILLLRNGLRVSEITEPENIRKIDDYSVSVYCRKTKSYRTCHLAEAAEIERKYQILNNIGMWKRDRYYYYRKMKGLIVDVDSNRTGNNPVTHAARNIRAQQTFEVTGQIEAASASLGHKSTKSTQSYLKPRQRGATVLRGIEDNVSGGITDFELTRNGVLRRRRTAI
jgi:Phage integrase family.